MRSLGVALVVLAVVVPTTGAAAPFRAEPLAPTTAANRAELDLSAEPYALLQLDRRAGKETVALVRRSGGRRISPALRIWRLPTAAARMVADLAAGIVTAVEPDRAVQPFDHLSLGDPLLPQEWWLSVVGADRAEPPGPGVPLTVLDSGLDLAHPEFAQRQDTVALNTQVAIGVEEVHGTAVSSVAAAPANGIGLVGIYPQALLQEWDFHRARLSDVIAGLDAASRRGRSVINLSGGFLGSSSLLTSAVNRVLARGSVVVAAVGNDRENGSRQFIPARLPHVLTVGASDRRDQPAFFSSRSRSLDLVAPGVDIPVAVPTFYDPSGFETFNGTSFSAPMVAGAAAWVWTVRPELDNTQLMELLRSSARDVGARGWDVDTGYGVLDVPAALSARAPVRDPQEPNEDVYAVKPGGLFAAGSVPLTGPSRPRASFVATLDGNEDPEDVYRIWAPAGRRVVIAVRGDANVDLALWGTRTRTVFERGAAQKRDLVDFSFRVGRKLDLVTIKRTARHGAYVYVDVFLGRRTAGAEYSLSVTPSARP